MRFSAFSDSHTITHGSNPGEESQIIRNSSGLSLLPYLFERYDILLHECCLLVQFPLLPAFSVEYGTPVVVILAKVRLHLFS